MVILLNKRIFVITLALALLLLPGCVKNDPGKVEQTGSSVNSKASDVAETEYKDSVSDNFTHPESSARDVSKTDFIETKTGNDGFPSSGTSSSTVSSVRTEDTVEDTTVTTKTSGEVTHELGWTPNY